MRKVNSPVVRDTSAVPAVKHFTMMIDDCVEHPTLLVKILFHNTCIGLSNTPECSTR